MPLPLPNLDEATFAGMVDEARKRIPVYAPQWTDHNVHDPGITIIELFAWLAEMQHYSLDRIGTRNYLKFLRLLGVRPLPASPAKVDVAFTSTSIIDVAAGTRLVAENSATGETTAFETDESIKVLPVSLKKLVSFASYRFVDITDFNAPGKSFFYAFGDKAEKSSALYLGFDFVKDNVTGKELRLSLHHYEDDLPPRGEHEGEVAAVHPSAGVIWEYWSGANWSELALASTVSDMVKTLCQGGRIAFSIPADIAASKLSSFDETLYWIRCRVVEEGYELPPRLARVSLNTVGATQGISTQEVLGPSTGLPYQSFVVGQLPVIVGSQTIDIEGEEWQAVDDFDASGHTSNHYAIDSEKGEIAFGDGINGRIPPADADIEVAYRYGGGEAGNIGAGAVSKAYDSGGALIDIEVTNPLPATGGRAGETLQDAILRARKSLKTPVKAVNFDDFEFLARATPGLRVARAKALVTAINTVTIVVVPYSPLEKASPSSGFLKTVCEHLDRHRLITTRIKVKKPDYVTVSVGATVRIKGGYKPEAVRQRVVDGLDKFLSPLQGGPDGSGWPFGRTVYRSEVYEVIDGVEGVDCASRLSINGMDRDLDIEPLSLVYPGRHNIDTVEPETLCREMK